MQLSRSSPLLPRKRTLRCAALNAASGHQRTCRPSADQLFHGPKLERIWVFQFPSFRVITYSESYVPMSCSSFVNLLYSIAQWTLLSLP